MLLYNLNLIIDNYHYNCFQFEGKNSFALSFLYKIKSPIFYLKNRKYYFYILTISNYFLD